MSWEQAPRSRQVRQWLWPGIAAVAALIAVVALVLLIRSDGPTGTLTIGPTAEPAGDAATPSVNPSDFAPTPLDPLDGSSEDAGDGPLLPDGPDVTVVIADEQDLRSINVATGDIRRSPVTSDVDPWTLFAVGDNVITNSGDNAVRITIADHRRVRLARNHVALPTLDDASVWVRAPSTGAFGNTVLRVGLDGTIRDRIVLPAIALPQAGVGASMVVYTSSGIHAVSSDGVRRITSSGMLTAISADRVAWLDCAADLTCQIAMGTHDDPDQARLPIAASELPVGIFDFSLGRFSPDGRFLALPLFRVQAGRSGDRAAVVIIDTATGAERTRLPQQTGPYESAPLAWSSDSRWLFAAIGSRLTAWDTSSGELIELHNARLGPIRGLAVVDNP
jgi:WD40 repeat protein